MLRLPPIGSANVNMRYVLDSSTRNLQRLHLLPFCLLFEDRVLDKMKHAGRLTHRDHHC